MSPAWLIVLLAGAGTLVLKAVGPVLAGGRTLPPRLDRMLSLLAPAVLAALVVTETFGDGQALVLDDRLVGLAAASIGVGLRWPLVPVIAMAAASTALVRLLA